MKGYILVFCTFFFLFTVNTGYGQIADEAISTKPWSAAWIAAQNDPGTQYGVYYFRKKIDLKEKPSAFQVKVSADNRYKLFVNGTLVSLGPAKGDLYYWNYETVDIAPFLSLGQNIITAIVWNEAEFRPEAQISLKTGFILQGITSSEDMINTNRSWKCIQDKGYSPITGVGFPAYYIAGASEFIDMNKSIKNWQAADFDDSSWLSASPIDRGNPKGVADASGWMLVPTPIPQMELKVQRIPILTKAENIDVAPSFPATVTPIVIPANTTATLLLDQTYLTNAYITFSFSRGKDAGISLSYAESLFKKLVFYRSKKSDRDSTQGLIFAGRKDSLISDGSEKQVFNSLYWRTYRYIKIRIQTKNEPLTIDDIYGTFTGYPFQLNAKLKVDDPEMQKIYEIGWRTARLCATETYMDCPYYEQLQYIGDTRIQAMVSYYNSGDDRLARQAINAIDRSRLNEGVTQSRYPSRTPQIISTFSLWYIGMLHDYWIYRNDSNFVKSKLAGERAVLAFFDRYQLADGSLKGTPYWTFVDWAESNRWPRGVPPIGSKGGSSILDLQLLLAYQQASEMEMKSGLKIYAEIYKKCASQLKMTIQKKYWDPTKKLYADTEDKDIFSQHANSLAILAGLVSGPDANALAKRILADSTLTQCTIYFKYYMHQALVKAGLGNDYLKWLNVWRKNMAVGLTTWAEVSDVETTRSDCHAWGASPNIEFFRTILGIDSYAPGFSKIKIEPHLGTLKTASGEIPHPNGSIKVDYQQIGKSWRVKIALPVKTSGIFIWNSKVYILRAGENRFQI